MLMVLAAFLPEAAAKANHDANLLAGLSASDIASMRAEARRVYAGRWGSVSNRSVLYRHRIVRVLQTHWAPKALQLIPVVESGYNPYALSHAGAVGLWQLMPATARAWGAGSRDGRNGRRDVMVSTSTAVRYLLAMFDRFDSWPLAIAGYHMGPYGLARKLKRHPWQAWQGINALPVPTTTRHYVRQVLGLVSLWQLGELRFDEPLVTSEIKLPPPVDIGKIAKGIHMSPRRMYRLNPGLDLQQYYSDAVRLCLPVKQAKRVSEQLEPRAPKMLWIAVKNGDSLWKISHRFDTTVLQLHRLNPTIGKLLHIGQRLRVPTHGYRNAVAQHNPLLSNGHRVHYLVRNGDTLWALSRKFGTTVSSISRINALGKRGVLHPGKWLWIKAHHQVGKT
ncbi:MAG: LysM peptidoglycan-binding domain-containing protein [Mariprofundales bacterium]